MHVETGPKGFSPRTQASGAATRRSADMPNACMKYVYWTTRQNSEVIMGHSGSCLLDDERCASKRHGNIGTRPDSADMPNACVKYANWRCERVRWEVRVFERRDEAQRSRPPKNGCLTELFDGKFQGTTRHTKLTKQLIRLRLG